MSRLIVLVPLAVVMALSACSAQAGQSPSNAAPSVLPASDAPTTVTTPTPTSTPTESATPSASAATCANLLDARTKTALEKAGMSGPDDYTPDKRIGQPWIHAGEYGGLTCQAGVDGSDVAIEYAYGPITRAQAESAEKGLAATATDQGTNEHGGDFFVTPAGGERGEGVYVFSPRGYWAFTNGSGDLIDIEVIVANAPVFY